MKIVELKGLTKSVQDGEKKIDVLKGLDLSLKDGQILAIVGKSGSGKTTLLNIISLLDTEYSGEYSFLGESLSGKQTKKLFKTRTNHIANIFQNFQLINDLNVLQNIEMPLGYRGIKKKERERIASQALASVGLEGREDSKVTTLSGGEQQRVAIARAIASEPKLLLADEPTGNLDERTAKGIIDLLLELNRDSQMSMIIVTHDIDIASQCNKLYTLEEGILYE